MEEDGENDRVSVIIYCLRQSGKPGGSEKPEGEEQKGGKQAQKAGLPLL